MPRTVASKGWREQARNIPAHCTRRSSRTRPTQHAGAFRWVGESVRERFDVTLARYSVVRVCSRARATKLAFRLPVQLLLTVHKPATRGRERLTYVLAPFSEPIDIHSSGCCSPGSATERVATRYLRCPSDMSASTANTIVSMPTRIQITSGGRPAKR